jgi:hypothetical protein
MDTNFIDLTIFAPSNTFSTNLKNNKKIGKNIKFDFQRYFNMRIMINGLDQSFGLLNLRYRYET